MHFLVVLIGSFCYHIDRNVTRFPTFEALSIYISSEPETTAQFGTEFWFCHVKNSGFAVRIISLWFSTQDKSRLMSLNNYNLGEKKTLPIHLYNVVPLQSHINIHNPADRFFFIYLNQNSYIGILVSDESWLQRKRGPLGLLTRLLQLS